MKVDFSHMTGSQLVDFYNRHSPKPVKRFSDRITAIRRCTEVSQSAPAKAQSETGSVMAASLKLDRTVKCLETGGVWNNPYRMWLDNPEWMTSGQQDRLTAKLYAAAKRGEALVVPVNGRSFQLLNVGDC